MNSIRKKNKGITLIALVITIVVLLILAGITIAALSGDNGILTRAKEAKEKTEKGNIIEQVNLAIMTATTEGTGTIDTSKLRKELEKNEIKVETVENSLPWKILAGNLALKIDENLAIEEISGKMKINASAKQIASNPERYYGKVAENYTQGGLTYRIFYVDTENKFGDGVNTVYLKADYKDTKSLSTDISGLTENDIAVYKRMNPSWAAERGSMQSSWNDNEKAAAWLCAPSQWEDYVDNMKAKYVMGGPSAEMYVVSYNDIEHKFGTCKEGLSVEYSAKDVPGYIYKVNNELYNNGWTTATDTLDYKGFESMYVEKSDSKNGWWIASPLSCRFNYVCYVNSTYSSLNCDIASKSFGICPLVSLKSGVSIEITE